MICNALPTIKDSFLPEIDDDTKSLVEKMQVGVDLSCKDWVVLLSCLALDNNLITYEHILPIRIANHFALVDYWHKLLCLNHQTTKLQFSLQSIFVIQLKKARTAKLIMNGNRRIKNYPANLILFHLCTLPIT